MASKPEKGLLNVIAIILLVLGALLSVMIISGVTNYGDEVKVIWYWIVGIMAIAGVTYLTLINK